MAVSRPRWRVASTPKARRSPARAAWTSAMSLRVSMTPSFPGLFREGMMVAGSLRGVNPPYFYPTIFFWEPV